MRYILLFLSLVLFAGCATAPSTTPATAVGSGLGAAEAYRATALAGAENPTVVRQALGDAAQRRSLQEAADALAAMEAVVAADHDAVVRLTAELQSEREQWIGDRGWRWIWTVIAVWLGLGLLSSYLSFATGGTSVLAGFLIRLLPAANLFPRRRKRGYSL